ncbi:MAG TPA: type 2 isopentenyl-diphosphate Delta-isomerase [Thermoflexia bacterium]|nr:type 2 isopentenyl-diphosphate Delta-isomerase [Thermoflexia bacterium]
MPQLTASRKDEHIQITLREDVTFDQVTTGLENYHFEHQALPGLDLAAISTRTLFLGKELAFPLLISSMTGGSPSAARLNQRLAEAAQSAQIGMGLGSLRAALEDPTLAWTYQVRQYAPHILLLANLGAVQLNYGYGPEECQRAVEMVEADGLILHLNPLQEALQPEGDTHFAGLLPRIEAVCCALEVPVIVKEVGWGLSAASARQLRDAGVTALDVAGAGGTSWSQVELYRSQSAVQREVAAAFRDWGIPTATALQLVRQAVPQLPVIASGGLRDGIALAKSLALGADVGASATPLLRAAFESTEALHHALVVWRRQFKIAMFAAGLPDIAALQKAKLIFKGTERLAICDEG